VLSTTQSCNSFYINDVQAARIEGDLSDGLDVSESEQIRQGAQ